MRACIKLNSFDWLQEIGEDCAKNEFKEDTDQPKEVSLPEVVVTCTCQSSVFVKTVSAVQYMHVRLYKLRITVLH